VPSTTPRIARIKPPCFGPFGAEGAVGSGEVVREVCGDGWGGVVAAGRFGSRFVGWLQVEDFVEAGVDVATGVVSQVLTDVDDDGEVWFGEGDQQPPGAVEVDHAEAFEGGPGEAVAGGVAAGAFQGEEGLLERVSDRSPQFGDDLGGVGGAGQAEPVQRSAAEKGSRWPWWSWSRERRTRGCVVARSSSRRSTTTRSRSRSCPAWRS